MMLQSHFEVLLEDCVDSHCQFLESKEEVNAQIGTVGNKADVLSSSFSTARGAADGR